MIFESIESLPISKPFDFKIYENNINILVCMFSVPVGRAAADVQWRHTMCQGLSQTYDCDDVVFVFGVCVLRASFPDGHERLGYRELAAHDLTCSVDFLAKIVEPICCPCARGSGRYLEHVWNPDVEARLENTWFERICSDTPADNTPAGDYMTWSSCKTHMHVASPGCIRLIRMGWRHAKTLFSKPGPDTQICWSLKHRITIVTQRRPSLPVPDPDDEDIRKSIDVLRHALGHFQEGSSVAIRAQQALNNVENAMKRPQRIDDPANTIYLHFCFVRICEYIRPHELAIASKHLMSYVSLTLNSMLQQELQICQQFGY